MQSPLTRAQQIFADSTRWTAAVAKTVELRGELNRRFSFLDIETAPWLRLVAEHYTRTYSGSFEFMLNLQAKLAYGQTDNQAAAALNCAIADWGRQDARVESDLPNVKDVVNSRFRVVQPDGSSLSVRLSPSQKNKDERVITYLGRDSEWTFAAFVRQDGTAVLARSASNMRKSLKAALDVLVNATREGDWLVHALAFSREGSTCCFCGRELDTLESIEMGYGPVCADKYGLPWGQTSKPQSVVEAAVTAASAEVEVGGQPTVDDSREPTEDDPSVIRGRQITDSLWKGHRDGTFESGSAILNKAGKEHDLDEIYGRSSYRPGRSYEEVFGEE